MLAASSMIDAQYALADAGEPQYEKIVSVHLLVGGGSLREDRLTIWDSAYLASSGRETMYRKGSFTKFLSELTDKYDALGGWWSDLDCEPRTADSDYLVVHMLLSSGKVESRRFRGRCMDSAAVYRVLRLLCAFETAGFIGPSGQPFETTSLACATASKTRLPKNDATRDNGSAQPKDGEPPGIEP